MAESNEPTIESNPSSLNIHNDNQVEKYFNFGNQIETILQGGANGDEVFHVVSYCKDKEVFQLFLTNNAFKSLKNISYQPTMYDKLKINEINKLLLTNFDLLRTQNDTPDNDYIEWSPPGDRLIKKRKEFRKLIDVYKTYDNQHPSITNLLLEIIEYYINEYLVQREDISKGDAEKLENLFKQGIEEKDYLLYFIKAYTLTNSFHRSLNKHLALYILDYFDPQSYSSLRTRYRLINCLTHIVTLLINHPNIDNYKYTGITYRGLNMTESNLNLYSIGNYIMNKSFVSTSKNRTVAEMFAGNRHLERTSVHHESTQIPVLLRYKIKQNQTAIDIQDISMILDEEEVLILPFSVFQVKDRNPTCSDMCSPALIEIYLEECEDDEPTTNRNGDEPKSDGKDDEPKSDGKDDEPTSNGNGDVQINDGESINTPLASWRHRSKRVYVGIGLCLILSLIASVVLIIIIIPKVNTRPPNDKAFKKPPPGKTYRETTEKKFKATEVKSTIKKKYIEILDYPLTRRIHRKHK